MNERHLVLIEQIRTELHNTPELAAYIIEAMTIGLRESASLQRERAADMEVVASMALHTRLFKGKELLIAQKLRKWQNKSALNWDEAIQRLESKK